MEIMDAVTALSAFAQETRLSIYRLLIEAGPEGVSAGRIAELLMVPGATLSFHLKELSHARLISSRQERQFIYYTVNFECMAELMTFLTENCCQGMPQKCFSLVQTALGSCCPPKAKTTIKKQRNQRAARNRRRL